MDIHTNGGEDLVQQVKHALFQDELEQSALVVTDFNILDMERAVFRVLLERGSRMIVVAHERPVSYYLKVLKRLGADAGEHLFLQIGENEGAPSSRTITVDSPKNLTEVKIAFGELMKRAKREGEREWVLVSTSFNALALYHEYRLLGQWASDTGRDLRRAHIYNLGVVNPDPNLELVLRPGFDHTIFMRGTAEGLLASALGAEVGT